MDDKKKSKPTSSKKKNDGSGSDDDYDPELDNLNEIEREQLILERKERKEKERRKQELEKEAKASKGAQKKELLSELQSKRQNAKDKKERMAAEERDDSEENDSESEGEINSKRRKKRDDEDFVVDDDKAMRGSRPEKKRKKSPSQEKSYPEKSQTLTMELLEKVRISRKNLALLCSHTIFEKTIKGAFVRVNQSSSSKASAHDYVIAEIMGVKDYSKYYPIDDKETNKILILKHGAKERPMKMCFVSNGEFTGGEFTKWINKMQREGQRIPAVADVERKQKEIESGLSYRYSDTEIRQNIDQRIQEKIRKGELLTYHEIEILENKKIQKERDYWSVNKRDDTVKKDIEKLEESIKKAKAMLKEPRNSKSVKKEEDRNVLNEMEEMFKDEDEDEKEPEKPSTNKNHGHNYERETFTKEVIEEDEDEKAENERLIEEMKKKGVSMTEMYEEMKKDFIKAHKVDLSIDKMIDEWEIEGEAAAS